MAKSGCCPLLPILVVNREFRLSNEFCEETNRFRMTGPDWSRWRSFIFGLMRFAGHAIAARATLVVNMYVILVHCGSAFLCEDMSSVCGGQYVVRLANASFHSGWVTVRASDEEEA